MTPSATEALLRTSLYELHLTVEARMVPFGGWIMPVQYRSILAEHQAVRESAGLFDLSHMGRLHFRGRAGRELLQWLSTNDVASLASGRAQYGLLCNEQGGILDDTVAYNLDDRHLLVVNASNRLKIMDWIEGQRAAGHSGEVQDATLETTMIGFQGPLAEAALQPLTDVDLPALRYYAAQQGRVSDIPALVARTGYTGEAGFELIVSAGDGPRLWQALCQVRQPVRPVLCGLGARDTLRLEAGMALYGHEIDEETNPFEAGLGRVIKLEKGEFVGRESLEKLSRQPPRRKLVGFQMVDNAVPRQGYAIVAGGERVGEVTSGSYSPTLKRNLGLAYVWADLAEPGTGIAIVVRERAQRAVVVALPHYPHRTQPQSEQQQMSQRC